jgi:hypothetical protein
MRVFILSVRDGVIIHSSLLPQSKSEIPLGESIQIRGQVQENNFLIIEPEVRFQAGFGEFGSISFIKEGFSGYETILYAIMMPLRIKNKQPIVIMANSLNRSY